MSNKKKLIKGNRCVGGRRTVDDTVLDSSGLFNLSHQIEAIGSSGLMAQHPQTGFMLCPASVMTKNGRKRVQGFSRYNPHRYADSYSPFSLFWDFDGSLKLVNVDQVSAMVGRLRTLFDETVEQWNRDHDGTKYQCPYWVLGNDWEFDQYSLHRQIAFIKNGSLNNWNNSSFLGWFTPTLRKPPIPQGRVLYDGITSIPHNPFLREFTQIQGWWLDGGPDGIRKEWQNVFYDDARTYWTMQMPGFSHPYANSERPAFVAHNGFKNFIPQMPSSTPPGFDTGFKYGRGTERNVWGVINTRGDDGLNGSRAVSSIHQPISSNMETIVVEKDSFDWRFFAGVDYDIANSFVVIRHEEGKVPEMAVDSVYEPVLMYYDIFNPTFLPTQNDNSMQLLLPAIKEFIETNAPEFKDCLFDARITATYSGVTVSNSFKNVLLDNGMPEDAIISNPSKFLAEDSCDILNVIDLNIFLYTQMPIPDIVPDA